MNALSSKKILKEEIRKDSLSHMVKSYSKIINEIIIESSSIIYSNKNILPFSSKIIPPITINIYLDRIVNFMEIDKPALVISMIYIDRVCQKLEATLNKF